MDANHWPNAVTIVDAATVEVADVRAIRTVALDRGAVTGTRDADAKLAGGWQVGAAEVRFLPKEGEPVVRWTGTAEEAASDGGVLWVRAKGELVRIAGGALVIPTTGIVTLAAGAGVAWVETGALKVAGPDGVVTCTLALQGAETVTALDVDGKWVGIANAKGTLLVDRTACQVVAAAADGATALTLGGGGLVAVNGQRIRRYALPNLTAGAWHSFAGVGLYDARDGRARRAPTGVVAASDLRALDDALVAFDPGTFRLVGFDGTVKVQAEVPLRHLVAADAWGQTWIATDGDTIVSEKGSWSLPGTSEVVMMSGGAAAARVGDAWVQLNLADPSKRGQADDRAIQTRGAAKVAYVAVPTTSARWRIRKDVGGVRVVGRWDQRDRGVTLRFAADAGVVSQDGTFVFLHGDETIAAYEVASGKQVWSVPVGKTKGRIDLYRGIVHLGQQSYTASEGKPTISDVAPMPRADAPKVGDVAFDPKVVTSVFSKAVLADEWCSHRDEVRALLVDQPDLLKTVTTTLSKQCRIGGAAPKAPTLALVTTPDATATCTGTLADPVQANGKAMTLPVTPGVPTLVVHADKNPFPRWLGEVVEVVVMPDKGKRAAGVVPPSEVKLPCAKAVPRNQAMLVDAGGKVRGQGLAAALEIPALSLALGLGAKVANTPTLVLPSSKIGAHEVLADGGIIAWTEGVLLRWNADTGLAWQVETAKGKLVVVGGLVLVDTDGLTVARSIEDGAARWAVRGTLKGVEGRLFAVDDEGMVRVYEAGATVKERWSASADAIGDDIASAALGWTCSRVFSTGAVQPCGRTRTAKPEQDELPAGVVLAQGVLTVTKEGRQLRSLRGLTLPVVMDAHRVVFAVGGPQGPHLVVTDAGTVPGLFPPGALLGAKGGVVWIQHGEDAIAAYRL